MHPVDCPPFEYGNHPRRAAVLPARIAEVLRALAEKTLDGLSFSTDSRRVHHHLFNELTPPACDYYAGHYRGEPFRCLRYYPVAVPNNPKVGFPPGWVRGYMAELSRTIRAGVAALDLAENTPDAVIPRAQKVLYAVTFACQVAVTLTIIHPYADGNGHTQRLIVYALLGRYGYWPKAWRVEPRPDPPYAQLVAQWTLGNKAPFEQYILQQLVP